MSVEYDDGGRDVPAGITWPVERVIVVGAGIAGLTVAAALAHGGIECVVLEARSRLGGRLHTIDLAGAPVDMGGSWIHHPIGNPLRVFAEQADIACTEGNPLPGLAGYDCAEGRRLSPVEVAESLDMQFERFPRALVGLRERLGEDASAAQGIDTFVRQSGLASSAARRARQALRALTEADAADLAERQSLRWLWNEIEYDGDFFGDLPVGGYRSLVDAMAGGLDVRLGVEVKVVETLSNGVRVRDQDNLVEEGSHVVVSVPLGVLKAGAIRFRPPLPPDRLRSIERLGFGYYEKVALRFDHPFWRPAGLSHLMIFPRHPDEPTLWLFDLDAFGAGPSLVAHVFHSDTGHVLDVPPNDAAEWVLSLISEALGEPCPRPIATAVSAWAHDPFTRGAYTHVPPAAHPGELDLLGKPIGGRILFAGEHTQSARAGYADGAMTSGIREAKRLLGTATVRLDIPTG